MKKYYISATSGSSGISKYSKDFYELVLKEKDYIFINSAEANTSVLSKISSQDHIHFEIGIFQKREIELLLTMLDANYKNIAVTLHDPPLLKYPLREFRNPILNNLSKFYDLYIRKFRNSRKYIHKIKTIYVLSHKGLLLVTKRYRKKEVYYLPHIVDQIQKSQVQNNNLLYLGFIGRNKGIEYALQLHQQLLNKYPESIFYIIGSAMGKEKRFYEKLRRIFTKNVFFLGYLPDEELEDIFNKAAFSLQLFKNYRFYTPFSGSILYSLKKGKIMLSNPVNSVPEIIKHGETGFLLSGELQKDINCLSTIFADLPLLEEIKNNAYNYLLQQHSATAVKACLRE